VVQFMHDIAFYSHSPKPPIEVEIVAATDRALVDVTPVGKPADWFEDRYGSAYGGTYVPVDRLYATKQEADAAYQALLAARRASGRHDTSTRTSSTQGEELGSSIRPSTPEHAPTPKAA
jgi:hypothetical protein